MTLPQNMVADGEILRGPPELRREERFPSATTAPPVPLPTPTRPAVTLPGTTASGPLRRRPHRPAALCQTPARAGEVLSNGPPSQTSGVLGVPATT